MKNDKLDSLKTFISTLVSAGISETDSEKIKRKVEKEICNQQVPKIALIGFTGVGKSSTLNALFNAGQKISDVKACTQKEAKIVGSYKTYRGSQGEIIIYDMPGLGEDLKADKTHYETYKRVLPHVDVAVWIFHADDRTMTPMQDAITKLKKDIGTNFTKKLVFAVNKADAVAPGELDWNSRLNLPSDKQKENLLGFQTYVKSKIKHVIPNWNDEIVLYSAKKHFNLDELMLKMIEATAENKRWVLNDLVDMANYLDHVDPELKDYVKHLQSTNKNQNSKSKHGNPYE